MTWLEGTVIENRHWSEALFSLRLEGARPGFEAGQFVRIALDIGGERIARPFSFVNPPDDPVLEFYGIVVPEGPLSPCLARREAGEARFRNVVLVHAVRFSRELVYQDLIGKIQNPGFKYVTFVSREPHPGSLAGRIPAAMRDGRLEAAAGVALSAATSHVMLCGNPQMLKDAAAALAQRGMRKHRRRAPGHITVESFW